MHSVVEQTHVYDHRMMDGEFFLLLAEVCVELCVAKKMLPAW
jgi:hypothetical protein